MDCLHLFLKDRNYGLYTCALCMTMFLLDENGFHNTSAFTDVPAANPFWEASPEFADRVWFLVYNRRVLYREWGSI